MVIKGTAFIDVKMQYGNWCRSEVLIASDLNCSMLINTHLQKLLGFLHKNYPNHRKPHLARKKSIDDILEDLGNHEDYFCNEANREKEIWPPLNIPEQIRQVLIKYDKIFVDHLVPENRIHGPPMTVELK